MFEAHVLHLLRKYLGEYVHGLSTEALRISVWKGDVVLKDLRLKAEALNALKLPVTVNAGFVGTITLKVPWKSLGKEPVIVLIDRVFILAHPSPDGQGLKEEDRDKIFQAKLQHIEEAELATLEAATRGSKAESLPTGNSWLGSLIATIIGNLKITISNVHIRYEDTISNPGHPFCSGITLAKLAAVTMDEYGNETFDTSGALDKLRKSLHLQRLALYHDSDSNPWKLKKKWEYLSPVEWTEIFADGIDAVDGDQSYASWAMNRKYLVSPINGVLKYHRLGKQERNDPETPFEKASLVLGDVSLTILEAQYYDGILLLEALSKYKTRIEVSHLRPIVPISKNSCLWWRYAVQATLQQKKMCHKLSWERIKHLCQLRRHYVQLYASSLQHSTKNNNPELREIEKDLDSKVIILWRLLAHARVESVKSKEVSQQRSSSKSWWPFGWNSSDDVISEDSGGSTFVEEKLTREEWKAINKMLSYEVDDDVTLLPGKDMQTMIQFLVDISVGQAAARIVSINQTEILCGRFEQLNVTTKFYHKSIHCDVLLRFCGLSALEGTLAQSVSSEEKINALAASFVHLPAGENVDWRLSATIAPCHVTIFMKSYERFLDFMKRSNAVSPVLALETATALQMKIEKVTRKAQEQFQMVLEEKNRFALDIDFDAPKVSIPLGDCLRTSRPGYFLLDFGHFTLQTREVEHDEQRQSLYSRFHISGKDIAAFFKDGTLAEGDSSVLHFFDAQPSSDTSTDDSSFYSLIDRCRMSVIVDQIKVPHPSYPSTRISIQVPNLGIHFSPARYCRIYDLLDIFYSSTEIFEDTGGDTQSGMVPWCPADLTSDARVLVWKGIGNSLAKWQPCYLILSGLYLYVLESASSQFYQRCCSMFGRHAFEVSPASVGGSLFSIAICVRGSDIQKALESSSTLVIEFRDDAQKSMWLRKLVQASYRASAPPAMDIFGKARNGSESHSSSNNLGTPDLVINGALVELKLSLYGKVDRNSDCDGERLILELLANGGKVHLVRSVPDLTAKIKLHSLKIGDGLQGHISASQHYLACSMLDTGTSFCALNCKQDGAQKNLSKEDDIFKDALQDFMFIPDRSFDSESDSMVTNTRYSSIEEKKCHAEMTSVDGDHENNKIRAKRTSSDVFYEAEDIDSSDFVDIIFIMRYPDSPLYDGTDTHMSVRMSKIDFFCNRPTVVALLELGWDLSLVNSRSKAANDKYGSTVDTSHIGEKTGEGESSIIKGLLGHGKKRIVFYLSMDMDSVSVFLNKEDGSQLAMFVQERFLFELKVHPSSISVDGTLGNMKLYDLSVEPNHCWGCLCDIRDQNVESLIKFSFQSYYAEDDDYVGHDYSLSGHLSAVRIVFLYRFVQEIMAYFMELATPHTEEVIKFVDKVGGFEWFIHKYEVDGADAIKLDLSLDTPLIIVPYYTRSKDFMQLDLGQLRVSNHFVWYGGNAKDPSAVHLDILRAEIQGISMGVGIDGSLGKPVIREAQGFEISVRRSLRDVFRKVPTVSVDVKIGLLHFVMSDKEYKIIMDCAYTNISEEPNIPPSFRVNSSSSKDSIRLLAEKVNVNSQVLLSRTVGIVCVDIQHAKLELCNGLDEETPLAQIALEGLWVSYRYTSLSETDLYVTIPRFTVLDIRPDTKPEMRLMLGVSSDVPKQGRSSYHSDRSYHTTEMDMPSLTMLVMDYRWRSSSQSFVIRMQQPRILVVLDFLLAVVEFFVPALRSITGREEALNPKNDPVVRNDNIILVEPIHMQKNEVIVLSPRRQLVVDGPGTDEIIYDGCGGSIHLSKCEVNDCQVSELKPLIIIGNGKRLRFKNVKIKNRAMLLQCTHLGSNSSYSVCEEDNVELSLEDFASNTGHIDTDEDHRSIKDKGATKQDSHELQTQSQSFSFEAQVISPELTFYDSTKVSLDDSLFTEKQLRVRMDVSFMFAAKENDVWVRSLLKDLTVEAGSGLIVLDPVDISGGYTSVKDKTNMSVISSDICIHLSLTVASLLLQLQQQASAALQFGNADPIAACTNFRRLWISQKASVPGHNLTFWRPQAPSNYAILGDCVTSRPIPPSQVVMAISNAYGRVKKPVGFKFIGFLSDIQGLDDGKPLSTTEHSLWEPVAPPGYIAVGCVVHPGSEAPPNHIVYCIRADLVTSGKISDCILAIPPNQRMLTGFSIWRIENAVGTFCAHAGLDCPSKAKSFDLHHILLHNHDNDRLLTKKSNSSDPKYFNRDQIGNDPGANISGWDVLRSFSKSSSCYMSVPHFERIWWDKGCEIRRPISIWRPSSRPGYAILGDCVVDGLEPPSLGVIFKCDSGISAKPVQLTRVAQIIRKGHDDAFFWYPVAPPGYASLGCIVTKTDQMPNKDLICCPRMDLVKQASISEIPICKSSSRGCNWSIWKVENQASTFLARLDLKRPSSSLAFMLSDYVKPRARQNISAEMKLGSFSLTVLDSMMAPLCDITVTNTSLATHGRPEAMNAVLICSVAASTFNRQLEAWEPLVEPFDGIFKLETYETNGETSAKIGKRVRVAATSTVDVNISASNLETLTESIISWRTQMDLEKKSTKKNEECCDDLVPDDDSAFSALEKNDFNKVVLENRLGCDLYLKKVEQSSETIQLLEHGNHATVSIPPPRFSDRLNVVSDSKEARSYIAVWIFQAQRLPILDDGNGHDFFCALRLVTDSHVSDRHKLFPQSARTRSIKPLISKVDNLEKGAAKWNELFIVEVPEKGSANLELEITNLSSKAGKGEIIGALSIPIRNKAGSLRRIGSVRMLLELGRNKELSSYSLKRRGEHSAENQDCGSLLMSTYFIERSTILDLQREVYDTVGTEGEIGFWVGLSRKGLWESFGSILAFSVAPKLLDGKYFAFEVSLKNGKKHAVFRPLATLINNTDVKLEVSVCPSSALLGSHGDMNNCLFVVEEIFENQRCQPSGSNKKMAGPHGTDPGRWSTRDLSHSSNSQDIFDISLPPGWKWTSAWAIDKSGSVDSDGWAYGTNFQSIRWPPVSNNSYLSSSSNCVRRRRWVRSRQTKKGFDDTRDVFAIIEPGSSAVLPWQSLDVDLDFCLQVRPCDKSTGVQYAWSQTFGLTAATADVANDEIQYLLCGQSPMKYGNVSTFTSAFKLNQLQKRDVLLLCNSTVGPMQPFWLSAVVDASVLHTDINIPVYDWKITLGSPFRLENKLPCQAEYSIREKTLQGNIIVRQHGILLPESSVFVYSADLRRPIYLKFYVHDDWVLEKDDVLIMDLSALEHASSFWMVHKESNRRLRLSIERDIGGSIAAPKAIRIFVPYWIKNDSPIALSYRIVEIEPSNSGESDSPYITKAVKSAKLALKHSSSTLKHSSSSLKHSSGSLGAKFPSSKRNIQLLEAIEEPTPLCVMLSPFDYMSHSGILQLTSRSESCLSPRIGIAIAAFHSENYGPGISLYELENKERIDVKAFTPSGTYYRLSATLIMASDRTKVVHFQPHTLIFNRVGRSIFIKQFGTEHSEWFHPADLPKLFEWHLGNELLELRVEGYHWSTPFSMETEGVMNIPLRNEISNELMFLRAEVRNGAKNSCYEIILRRATFSSPYRMENRSMFLPVRFRQANGFENSWQFLPPNASASFCWEDLGRQQLLEVLVNGNDPSKSEYFNIDDVKDYEPMQADNGPVKCIHVAIVQEGKTKICRISDWMPVNESLSSKTNRLPPPSPSQLSNFDDTALESELHVIFELADLGVSIIDRMPEEILYFSMQNLLVSYSSGLGSGVSRLKLRVLGMQVDNQLPFTPMPVLFRPQRSGLTMYQPDYILKLSVTMQKTNSLNLHIYPYVGVQGPDNSAFLINIHEPIIWRLHEMIQQAKLNRIYGCSQSSAVSIDPTIQIGLLNISEVRFKVSLTMSPAQRPGGVLGFWSSLMTALGNMENMLVKINQRSHEDICMRQSALISNAMTNIQKDLLSQPLRLLSGVDILGNASSALGHMSKGVAALSMDKKFIQSRQKQESKGVEDIGDVIREGGGALAKGFFRGVTGILTKPLEGAKSSGVEGFVQGVGKGIIGAAAQPVSGVLDLLSKTTEGANAVRMKIASAITSEEQLLRKRLPRAIGGDNLLKPFDGYRATGQAILQLAESGTFLGQVDLFKVRGKFALSDAYEDHFLLPDGKVLLVTHRRVLLLQQPSHTVGQKKFSPSRDPCSVLWDVLWDNLVTMELILGKKEPQNSPSSVMFYLATSTESRENVRVIKCHKDSLQAIDIYNSVEKARSTYGPTRSKELQRKVTKPYSPVANTASAKELSKEVYGIPVVQVPSSLVSTTKTFGAVLDQH